MDALEFEPLRPTIGQCIGNYRLIALLGSGAFANIYLGEHCYLRTRVAIKVSRRQLTRGQRERFLKEAQIAAKLAHPLIIRVLGFDIEQGIPYLVMDYASQGSLRRRHPIGTRLERETILGYAWDIAEALEYIHGHNYIHRDLKPENLLIGTGGEILVSDFGIAIGVQETRGQQELESIGTLPYMAPEQINGRPAVASDQYALGVIIYEWICGVLPFDEEASNLAWLHLNARPPDLREMEPDLPEAVEQVIQRALAKDPRQRFASVSEFVEQLEIAWTIAQPSGQRNSFYEQATYQTDTPDEIPAIARQVKQATPLTRGEKEPERVWRTWKNVSLTFALDLLFSITARFCIPDASSLPLWIAAAVIIAGLPIGIGWLLDDRRTLTMAGLILGLEIASVLFFRVPLAFIDTSIAGTSLCMLITLAAYLRFLN